MHRYELTDFDETYQTGIFNNGDHDDKGEIRQIGTWKQEMGRNSRFFTCIHEFINLHTFLTDDFAQFSYKIRVKSGCECPGSRSLLDRDFDFTIVISVIESLDLESFIKIREFRFVHFPCETKKKVWAR